MSHFDHLKLTIPEWKMRQPRNYVDLYAGRLRALVNPPNGTVGFYFPVKNLGDLPARGPFSIVVGVSYRLHSGESGTIPQSYTHEAVYTFSEDSEIPGGSTYQTPPIVVQLGYIDVSLANRYTVEINVDSELQVQERSEANNRLIVDWFTTSGQANARFSLAPALAVPSVAVLERITKDGKEVDCL